MNSATKTGSTYAIDYVLFSKTGTIIVNAPDRDEAYYAARAQLRAAGFVSASLQGSCRVASQADIDRAD